MILDRLRFLTVLLALASPAMVLTACDDDGLEEAGEELDEGINDLGRDIEDATD